jgi:hypothetical protein
VLGAAVLLAARVGVALAAGVDDADARVGVAVDAVA